MASAPTYVVMELVGEPLIGLFAAWRAEIDSVPFAHEAACDKIVQALLDDYNHRLQDRSAHIWRSRA